MAKGQKSTYATAALMALVTLQGDEKTGDFPAGSIVPPGKFTDAEIDGMLAAKSVRIASSEEVEAARVAALDEAERAEVARKRELDAARRRLFDLDPALRDAAGGDIERYLADWAKLDASYADKLAGKGQQQQQQTGSAPVDPAKKDGAA